MLTRLKTHAKSTIKKLLLSGRFRSRTFKLGSPTGNEMPVLMCLWNRPGRFTEVLRQLDAQDFSDGIRLLLWNNNRGEHRFYTDALAGFEASGSLKSVSIVRSPFNLGSIGRFYWARKLALAGRIGPIVVIDDDENLSSDFISVCARVYEPRVVSAWWAFAVFSSYFDRTPSEIGGRVDHVGPGGMVCNAELFLDPRFFEDLPERFWFLDDLWFTYFAKTNGYALAKLPVEMEFVLPDTNQHHHLGDLKNEFFNVLYAR